MAEILSSGILSKEMKERSPLPEPAACTSRKPTPVECIKMGLDIGKAQIMTLDDLTAEDAKLILDAGYGPATLQTLYGIKSAGSLYPRLVKWGLHKKGADPRPKMAGTRQKRNKPPTMDVKTFQDNVYEEGRTVQAEQLEQADQTEQLEQPARSEVPTEGKSAGQFTRSEFLALLSTELESIQQLFEEKNQSYGTVDDLFYNFRQTAIRIFNKQEHTAMFTVLMTLVDKHLVPLANKGLDDKECAERLRDVIVYALIGIAMWKEMHYSNGASGPT